MLGLGNTKYDESIKEIPSDMVSILFSKDNGIDVNALSLTVLELISRDQIRCDIDLDDSYEVGKKLTSDDMEVMKGITLRIANRGELKTSQSAAINLLKNLNKGKKFNLKAMAKQTNNHSIANKFDENYTDILKNGKLTAKGNEIKKQWKVYADYLKSNDLTEKYPPESEEESTAQILYAACFDVEREALKARENNNSLTDFIDKDGYKLLNIIFNNALLNVTEKRKGDGIFYGVNDKYTVPGA